MYGTDERMPTAYWRNECAWVSDRHTLRADGTPTRRPSYKVGDHLVVYLASGARQACPAILRVTKEPVFDPKRVRAEGKPGDDKTWAWLTEVEFIAAVRLDWAPRLGDIGVRATSVRQHGHIGLDRTQYRKALKAIRRE